MMRKKLDRYGEYWLLASERGLLAFKVGDVAYSKDGQTRGKIHEVDADSVSVGYPLVRVSVDQIEDVHRIPLKHDIDPEPTWKNTIDFERGGENADFSIYEIDTLCRKIGYEFFIKGDLVYSSKDDIKPEFVGRTRHDVNVNTVIMCQPMA